ncbi:MAG: hypothetical protein ACRC57_02700 [Sarcina sp.]
MFDFFKIIEDFCLFSTDDIVKIEYKFFINNQSINYDIRFDMKEKILIEKLYVDGKLLLNRIGQNAESEITENKNFSDLDNSLLLLREIYFNTKFRKYETLKKWFVYLSNSIYIDAYEQSINSPVAQNLLLSEYLEKHGADEINKFFKTMNFEQEIEYDKI